MKRGSDAPFSTRNASSADQLHHKPAVYRSIPILDVLLTRSDFTFSRLAISIVPFLLAALGGADPLSGRN